MTLRTMLASDREREATVLRLRAAHLEGRINTEELEARVGWAQAARTVEELDALVQDVPDRDEAAIETTDAMPWLPGRRHFTERKLLDAPPAEIRAQALAGMVPALERHFFYLQRETVDTLVFANRREVASRVTVRLLDAGDRRTLVLAHGYAPLRVRRAFAGLRS